VLLRTNFTDAVFMTLPRLLLHLAVLTLLLAAPQALAERKPAIGIAPPQPVEMSLKVRRDAKTDISLRIVGKAGEPLKYLIRVPPEHGRLSEPRSTEREVSVVNYQPPADLSITADKFSYAVQNSIGVSGSVEVNITIVDEQPRLSFPDALDFAKIRAGSSNYRLLEISNQGGLIATGEVFVDPPWRIDGKNGYRLKAGDVAVFKIFFEPTTGGDFEGVARFTSEPEHSTTLRGAAVAVIAANPARWILEQTPGDVNRAGTFELTNNLDEARTLQLKADPRLKIPAELTLPAHGTVKVPVEASSSEVGAFDTEIRLNSPPDLSIPVPVRVPTLAAIVRPTAASVSFGRLPFSGHDATAPFELENSGGMPATVTWEVSPPFKVKENSATLQPGEKKTFNVAVETNTPNRYRTWLHFKAGTQAFDLPVEAEVVGSGKNGPGGKPSLLNAFGKLPNPAGKSNTPANPLAEAESNAALVALRDSLSPDMLPTRPPPPGVRIAKLMSTYAVLEWPANFSPASQYRVEVRLLGVDPSHKLQIKWQELQDTTLESHAPDYAIKLKDLEPGQPWTFRVRPVEIAGRLGAPLFTISFSTPPRTSLRPHFEASTFAELLVVALLALVGWQAYERTRHRSIL
jgi:hypothetical protein